MGPCNKCAFESQQRHAKKVGRKLRLVETEKGMEVERAHLTGKPEDWRRTGTMYAEMPEVCRCPYL